MRFTSILVTGAFALFASAQTTESATTTAASTASTTASLTAAQSSAAACLNACDAGDVSCTAKCIAVPNPSSSQVNATTECVAGCDQGNGTAADNTNYSNCVQSCIGDNYFTSTGTPEATDAAGAAASSDATATATGTGASASGSSTGTASSSASSSTATGSGADAVRYGATGLSVLALVAGAIAL